jgi:hypothetical protein
LLADDENISIGHDGWIPWPVLSCPWNRELVDGDARLGLRGERGNREWNEGYGGPEPAHLTFR